MDTTTAQDQQSRAEFEAWARRACYEVERHESGQYARNTTEQVWQSWQAARALPAGVEPAAEVLSSRPGNDTSTIDKAFPAGTKLFTAAQVLAMLEHRGYGEGANQSQTRMDAGAAPGCGLPQGWQAVPVEPTDSQLAAVRQKPHPTSPDGWDSSHRRLYSLMLAAAPRPPAAPDLLQEAVSRIKDMLKDDDGQAWKEARKFVDKVEAIGITHPTGD